MKAGEKAGNGVTDTREEQRSRESFDKACKDLWEQDVRSDLIYRKGLMCCQLCLGMFYASDLESNHPKKYCFLVSQVCAERGIGTLEAFQRALWQDASTMAKQYGHLVVPRITSSHEDLSNTVHLPKEVPVNWSQIKIGLLEKEVDTLTKEKELLLGEKKALEHEVQLLVQRLFDEKIKVEGVKLRAQRHLEALDDLLHPDGCCCGGQHEEVTANKTK